MASWRDVPIPERMASLPRDRRGFPVPFIVAHDAAGEPVFTVNDDRKTMQALTESRCGICGGELEYGDLWWVGGPLSAFHPHGMYIDGPMHEECSTYALRVCPHLAAPNYSRRIDDRGRDLAGAGFTVGMDQTVMPERPAIFVQGCSISYDVTWPLRPDRKLRPVSGFHEEDGNPRRWVTYEVWRHGEILEEEEGILAIRAALEDVANRKTQRPRIYMPESPEIIV